MPIATAQKVEALGVDFRSAARLADLLGVSRSQVTRWLRGSGIDPANAEKVDLLELDPTVSLIDLDDPGTLAREALRPSVVATRDPHITQPQARALFRARRAAAGLRSWSTYEALWANVTLFDRAASRLRLLSVRTVTIDV